MTPHPKELRFRREERLLHIVFDTDETVSIPFELLRVESPSAEVKGHGTDQPPPVLNKANVSVTAAEPVGHYAVRIVFDDGHDSGLFTWARLLDLGKNKSVYMESYHQRVAEFQGPAR